MLWFKNKTQIELARELFTKNTGKWLKSPYIQKKCRTMHHTKLVQILRKR